MDLIKKLTGKNPSEYESVAQSIIDNADEDLYKKLIDQDDFLFDFIKRNVAQRLQHACNKNNYLNLLKFFKYYSPSYIDMIAEVLKYFGRDSIVSKIKPYIYNGNSSEKACAIKCLAKFDYDSVSDLIPDIRELAESQDEAISGNSAEFLGIFNDEESKNRALLKLKAEDDFEKFDGVKFLISYGAKDTVKQIIEAMKESGFSENIACEIPYLIPITDLINSDYENGSLVLCNIINAIPDIIPPSSICDFDLYSSTELLVSKLPDSIAALVLRMEKDKINELLSNEEYLFDSDKNTKDEINELGKMLNKLNSNMLTSLLYDELYDESNFVLFAIDYAEEIAELETLTQCKNPTVVLKALTKLKEKGVLSDTHKTYALNNFDNNDILNVIEAL